MNHSHCGNFLGRGSQNFVDVNPMGLIDVNIVFLIINDDVLLVNRLGAENISDFVGAQEVTFHCQICRQTL